jgi:hypothetical protein
MCGQLFIALHNSDKIKHKTENIFDSSRAVRSRVLRCWSEQEWTQAQLKSCDKLYTPWLSANCYLCLFRSKSKQKWMWRLSEFGSIVSLLAVKPPRTKHSTTKRGEWRHHHVRTGNKAFFFDGKRHERRPHLAYNTTHGSLNYNPPSHPYSPRPGVSGAAWPLKGKHGLGESSEDGTSAGDPNIALRQWRAHPTTAYGTARSG